MVADRHRAEAEARLAHLRRAKPSADRGSTLLLATDEVANAAKALVESGVEAVAVSFLHAYANAAHEKAAGEIIRQIAPHAYISLSRKVNPEWREYERTATTVANAYIGPPVARYLRTSTRWRDSGSPAHARS